MSKARLVITILYIVTAALLLPSAMRLHERATQADKARARARDVFSIEHPEEEWSNSHVYRWYQIHRVRSIVLDALGTPTGVFVIIGGLAYIAGRQHPRSLLRVSIWPLAVSVIVHYALGLYAGWVPVRYLQGYGGVYFYTAFLLGIPFHIVYLCGLVWLSYGRHSEKGASKDKDVVGRDALKGNLGNLGTVPNGIRISLERACKA